MDQIDNNNLSTNVRQHMNNDLSFQYSLNYLDQFCQENNDENISISNVEYEQDENEQISMPIMYKKRIRTKFNPEQLDLLEMTFEKYHYPSVNIIDDLVEQLNLPTQKITIWFQNRRARLKKNQQKLDSQHSFEKDDQQQYDSGIHLDEDASHDSPTSPPANSLLHLPTPPPPSSSFMTAPSPYYLPSSHYPFYNPMWSNFGYPLSTPSFQSAMVNATNIPYNLANYNSSEIPSSFIFQDVSNYQHHKEFNGEL